MKEQRSKTWTDDEVEKLKNLADNNFTYQQISNELGRTINSIMGKCYQEGIEVIYDDKAPQFSSSSCKGERVFRKPNRNKIENRILWGVLYVEDITPPLLAELVGVSARTIQRALYDGYPPSDEVKKRVADVLNIPANILFGKHAYSQIDDNWEQEK